MTDCGAQFASHGQIGLGLRLCGSDPSFDREEHNPNDWSRDPQRLPPKWMDENWYRRLALPSVDKRRDI